MPRIDDDAEVVPYGSSKDEPGFTSGGLLIDSDPVDKHGLRKHRACIRRTDIVSPYREVEEDVERMVKDPVPREVSGSDRMVEDSIDIPFDAAGSPLNGEGMEPGVETIVDELIPVRDGVCSRVPGAMDAPVNSGRLITAKLHNVDLS